MGADRDPRDPGRDTDVVEVPGKRLLVVVWMLQNARSQDRAIWSESLDAVGITFPAGILATDGDVQIVEARTLADRDIDQIGASSPPWCGGEDPECGQPPLTT